MFASSSPMKTRRRAKTLLSPPSSRRPHSPRFPRPSHQYRVIYGWSPCCFGFGRSKGDRRNASSHYDRLDYHQLASPSITDLAAKHCTFFLWAVDPILDRTIDLIAGWGFTYETVGFYWVKLNPNAKSNDAFFTGLGHWTRANPETCLLATRGSPRRRAQDVKRLVVEPRRKHSRNQPPSEPASSACSTAPISNCSPAQPSQTGTPEATKSVSSTTVTPRPPSTLANHAPGHAA
jgi:N6-adenosine-specific RNA methylase IME4